MKPTCENVVNGVAKRQGEIVNLLQKPPHLLLVMLCAIAIVPTGAFSLHWCLDGSLCLSSGIEIVLASAIASFATFALVVRVYEKHLSGIACCPLDLHGSCSAEHAHDGKNHLLVKENYHQTVSDLAE